MWVSNAGQRPVYQVAYFWPLKLIARKWVGWPDVIPALQNFRYLFDLI